MKVDAHAILSMCWHDKTRVDVMVPIGHLFYKHTQYCLVVAGQVCLNIRCVAGITATGRWNYPFIGRPTRHVTVLCLSETKTTGVCRQITLDYYYRSVCRY